MNRPDRRQHLTTCTEPSKNLLASPGASIDEPYSWLKATLEAIAAGHPNDRIDELLPWNFATSSS